MLGVMLEQGRGVARDLADAARWYRLAAEQDDVTAQLNLGACYELGRGVAQDYEQAVAWYRRAATRAKHARRPTSATRTRTGVASPRTMRRPPPGIGGRPTRPCGVPIRPGDLYARALGVQRSDVEACRWFLIAESRAASPDDRAAYAAARERLNRRMTAAQRTEAQRLAREWVDAFDRRAK